LGLVREVRLFGGLGLVNSSPRTKFISSVDIKSMATNISTIGQQLRVEINSEYNKTPQN